MSEWVALLRGVNVGGVTIKNAELLPLFPALGATAAKAYLASGNVRFALPEERERGILKAEIERALAERFGYDAWIVLVSIDELRAAVDAFPFDAERDNWHPYVLFGSDPAVLAELHAFAEQGLDPELDVVAPGEGVLYWHSNRAGSIEGAFAREVSRSRYRTTTTNRNLRTLRKILA